MHNKHHEQPQAEQVQDQPAVESVIPEVEEPVVEPKVDEREVKLAEQEKALEEGKNKLLRLQAEFDNFRKRKNVEQEQLAEYVTANVVGKFLKVLDNFERAEASIASDSADAEALKSGLEKIRRQFVQALTELKVEEIAAQGEQFNPELHEAVMRGDNPDMPDNSVELVLEKGYKLGNRVIRHSKVKVVNNE